MSQVRNVIVKNSSNGYVVGSTFNGKAYTTKEGEVVIPKVFEPLEGWSADITTKEIVIKVNGTVRSTHAIYPKGHEKRKLVGEYGAEQIAPGVLKSPKQLNVILSSEEFLDMPDI